MSVRVGLVGCGTIGTALAKTIERRYGNVATLVGLTDIVPAHARRLQRQLRSHPPCVSLALLIRRSHLVLEAASVSVATRVATAALRAHRDVLIMSTGGLLMDRSWQQAARRSRAHLYVPSGALGGVDGLKAMATGSIRRMRLTTRKPPRALAAAPGLKSKRAWLTQLRAPRVVFEGSPQRAIRSFPQNLNVAATMTLAASGLLGASRRVPITVRIVADPSVRRNVHELEVESDAGRMLCRMESRPSSNPKTSEVAIRSAIATVAQLFQPVRVGT